MTNDLLTILPQRLLLVLLLIVPWLQRGEFTGLLLDPGLKFPNLNLNAVPIMRAGEELHTVSARRWAGCLFSGRYRLLLVAPEPVRGQRSRSCTDTQVEEPDRV